MIDKKFILQFAQSTERAAYGASLFKGKGDKIAADRASVNEMRKQLNTINMKGTVVIGEGEMDEAPMLYIGEEVGNGLGEEFDIAVDPLEGTNFIAKNLPNALSVIAIGEKGSLLNAPDTYMEKIAIGSNLPENLVDLDFSVEKNIKLLSEAKNKPIDKITACILKRDRHNSIINSLESMKVKINFIDDGDVMGVLSVANIKSNVDIYLGTGGAPEGVLAAAALSCMGCQMQTRILFKKKAEIERAKKFNITNLNKKYSISDMIKNDVIFCATAVTDSDSIKGIVDSGDYFKAETIVLHKSSNTNEILKNKIKK